MTPDTRTPLLAGRADTAVFWRRWYILALFSATALLDGILFNTWGPVSQSAKIVYGWSNTELALLINWGNVTYIVFIFAASYIMDVKGLRLAVLATLLLYCVGCGLRMATLKPIPATWLNNLAQVLIGFGGCVPYAGASLVSATWFPVSQRTTATAIASMACYLGDAAAFLIGPLIVNQLGWSELTGPYNSSSGTRTTVPPAQNGSTPDYYQAGRQRQELFRLYLIQTCCSGGLLLLVLAYFPNKPPIPPSPSSATQRMNYKKGFIMLSRSRQFWVINAAFSANGVFLGWTTVLAVVLSPVGVNQDQAGWIGFVMVIVSCVGGIFMSRLADVFSDRMKTIILCLYVGSAGSLVWLILLTSGVLTFSIVQVYVSCALIGLCLNGTFPLFLELACEGAYPVAEGITCGYLTMVHSANSGIFLLVLMIPDIGVVWMNYTLLAFIAAGLPFVCLYSADRNRSSRDKMADVTPHAKRKSESDVISVNRDTPAMGEKYS